MAGEGRPPRSHPGTLGWVNRQHILLKGQGSDGQEARAQGKNQGAMDGGEAGVLGSLRCLYLQLESF